MIMNTMQEKTLANSKITLEDILKIKEQLVTHYCFVHDDELRQALENAGIPQVEIKVTQHVEKGKIILIDKKMINKVL